MNIATTESGHWYTVKGEPVFEVTGANGRVRKPTLADARKHGWLPGCTSICKMWPSDGLRNWLRAQDILAAATTPRNGETDEEWVSKVLEAADEETERARATGSRRHDLLHQFHKDRHIDRASPDYPFLEPYLSWLRKTVSRVVQAEYITVNKAMGYAGTVDMKCILQDGRTAILDVKNRKRVATYDSDTMQLAGYAEAERSQGAGVDAILSVILGTEKPELFVSDWSFSADAAWENFQLCLNLWKRSKGYWPEKFKDAQALPF